MGHARSASAHEPVDVGLYSCTADFLSVLHTSRLAISRGTPSHEVANTYDLIRTFYYNLVVKCRYIDGFLFSCLGFCFGPKTF